MSVVARSVGGYRVCWNTYHWSNIGVRNSVKLLEVELVVGANIDVGALVLRHVAVFRSREHYS